MKILIIIFLAFFITPVAFAQKERKFVREGNGYYADGLKDTTKLDTITFGKAEVAYRRALEIKPDDFHWQFNLANSLYKQNKPDQSAGEFEKLVEKTTVPEEKSMVYHNLGNSLLAQKKFDPSIDAYKKALRITPNDPATKYNLAYAMKMKEEDQKQKQKDKDKQDKDNKDQNKDENKDQNKDNKDQNKDQQNQDQKQQPQPQNKISKQNAEQMLQALENDEKQTQEKVKKAQALQAKKTKVEKNW
jgi:Ca-activated chloride channel family protein